MSEPADRGPDGRFIAGPPKQRKPIAVDAPDRDADGRFVPGNPGGARKRAGLVALVRALTREGHDVAELYNRAAMRGTLPLVDEDGNEVGTQTLDPADRLRALAWLADRGFGRAVTELEVHVDAEPDPARRAVARLSDEDRKALLEMSRRALLFEPPILEAEVVSADDARH